MVNDRKNGAILQCPQCKKPLVNIASRLERLNPVARLIENYHFHIVGVWVFCILGIFALNVNDLGVLRSAGFALVAIAMLPSLIMYFLVRQFNVYRITECPYCKHRESEKIGRVH